MWADGKVFPCCLAKTESPITQYTGQEEIADLINHPNYKEMRMNMLSDKPCTQCEKCYFLEDAGSPSLRTDSNKMYENLINQLVTPEHIKSGQLDNFQLKFLDIRFSNLCNLACLTCSPIFSDKLYDIHKKMGAPIPDKKLLQLDLFEKLKPYLLSVTNVNFAGGEPLVSDDHYKILDYWVQNKYFSPLINYTSNLTLLNYNSYQVLDYWPQFKNISILASIDDMGKNLNYIRRGANWDKIVKNISLIRQKAPHVHLKISPTVSALNALNLFDLIQFFFNEFGIQLKDWQINILQHPRFFSVQHLSAADKLTFLEKFEKFQIWCSDINQSIDTVNSLKWLVEQKIEFHQEEFLKREHFLESYEKAHR